MLVPFLLALIPGLAVSIFPQALPTSQDSATPPRRAHHSMVYDAAGQRVLLTGGSTPIEGGRNFEFFNDLWAFDGVRWTRLPPSGAKSSGSQMAFNQMRNQVVAFGGFNGRSLADVRVLEHDTWRTIGVHPEMPTAEPGFIYDVRRNRFVAFGGSARQGQAYGDTWEFDGDNWTRVPTASPPARQAHSMVYDQQRSRTVVFGGMGLGPAGQRPPPLGDTWEFDGRSWSEKRVMGPSPRFGAGVAYDSKRGVVILFGGVAAEGFRGDTWSWNGTEWRKLADTGPEARGMGYLAYDAARDRVVLFGGRKGYPDGDLNDTWEWDGDVWHRVGS